MVWEVLVRRELFDFTDARRILEQFVESQRQFRPLPTGADAGIELMYLNAAEATLPPLGPIPERGQPVRIPPQAAYLAITASDCGPTWPHDARVRPRLWDVTLFGGDAGKLAWLTDTDDPAIVIHRLDDVRGGLPQLYDSPALPDVSRGVVAPHVVRLKTVVWRMKLAVILGQDLPEADVDRLLG